MFSLGIPIEKATNLAEYTAYEARQAERKA